MCTRWILTLVLGLAVPAQAAAQVAAAAPAAPEAHPFVAPAAVVAGPAAAPVPVVAAVPEVAPVPAAAPVAVVAAVPEAAPVPAVAAVPAFALASAEWAPPQAAQPAPPAVPAQPAQPAQPAAAGSAPRARAERAEARVREREERRSPSKGVNVRIDATVIESRGEQVTGRKVLTITLMDGEWGSVRSSQVVEFRPKGPNSDGYQRRPAPLNMDARALLRDDGRVAVNLKLEYQRGTSHEADNDQETAQDQGIRQSVTVILESGKPIVVAQSSDAVGDRRVALEVKATVLK